LVVLYTINSALAAEAADTRASQHDRRRQIDNRRAPSVRRLERDGDAASMGSANARRMSWVRRRRDRGLE
jgi:hypothetical protein